MKKALLLLLGFVSVAGIVEAKIIQDSIYQIPKTKVAPIIDGKQDNIWKAIDWNMQRIYMVDGTAADSGQGLTGMTKAMWDNNNLYLLFYSVDDIIVDIPANATWNQDAVWLYFDGTDDHSQETSLKSGQYFFIFPHWLKGQETGHHYLIPQTPFDTTGMDFKISDVTDTQGFPGWMTEVKIPLANLGIDGATAANHKIGWELQQDESDDPINGRQSMSKWWCSSNVSWANAGAWGTAILDSREIDTVLQILKTDHSITVDGTMDAAYKSANPITMNLFRVGDPPGTDPVDTDPMFGGFITAYPLWDMDNLYLFCDVVDEVITDIPANPGWNQDAVLIYIDGTNDHSPEFILKAGQFWFTIPHWLKGHEAGHLGYAFGTSIDTTGIEFKISDHGIRGNAGMLTEEGSGWNVELKIPLAALGIDGSVSGSQLGFELQMDNSNNPSLGRQGMEKWWNASDQSWANASLWGYAVLSDSIAPSAGLDPPTLVSPISGATGVSVNPTFTWNAPPGATWYTLQVSTDPSFGTTRIDTNGITATSLTVTGLSLQTKYYWRVRASNISSTSGWSSIWYFTPGSSLGWKITISASSGGISDAGSYAAVAPDASEGFDSTYDFPKPPISPGNYVYVYFPHPEWGSLLGPNFLTDVKRDTVLSSTNETWTFAVATDRSDQTMSLTLIPNADVPSNYLVFLKDLKTGSVQNIRARNTYYYNTASDSLREFQIIVGMFIKSSSFSFSAGWNMAGFPLKSASALKSSVLNGGSTTYLYNYWISRGYFINDTITRGKGCWLGALSPVTSTVVGSTAMDSVSIWLYAGWNMISLPYLDSSYPKNALSVTNGARVISLDSAVSLGWVTPVLYDYQPGDGSYSSVDSMAPWRGYWFAALDNYFQLIYNAPPNENPILSKRTASTKKALKASASNWFVGLTLQTARTMDRLGGFGINAGATSGFDAQYDFPHPPNPPSQDYVFLAFPHPEWESIVGPNFSRDIRSPESSVSWVFQVGSTGEATPATLQWDAAAIPAGVTLELTDFGNAGTKINMKSTNNYLLTINGIDTLQIASTTVGVEQQPPSIPTTFGLSQNFPNPFNPKTVISYQLPVASMTSLKIYDILGREIAALVNEVKSPGWYSIQWNAQNLPSGIYFYRLEAGSFVETRKLVLLK
jgi:hypothetical protein